MTYITTGIFINTNNTVYATSIGLTTVLVWPEGSLYPTRNISSDLYAPYSVFVTSNGDVYADNGDNHSLVEKWATGSSISVTAMYVPAHCGALFVDIYENVYCALPSLHKVSKRFNTTAANASVIVAGTGIQGTTSNMLWSPYGIFVDIDLSLYVADFGNSRIQLFRSGNLSGTAVAGSGAPATIALNQPTCVILDGDGYLFIADRSNHRIVGSGPNGFRCIAGCTDTTGAAANQLAFPYHLSFDSYGNLHVTDSSNQRIQKFVLARNACGKFLETFFQFRSIDDVPSIARRVIQSTEVLSLCHVESKRHHLRWKQHHVSNSNRHNDRH